MADRKLENRRRLFAALPLPREVKIALAALNRDFPDLKFDGDPHLTLSFIGDSLDLGASVQALSAIREESFSLKISGLGLFSQGILWAAPTPSPELFALKRAVDIVLERVGYEPESRAYKPHITLCRLRKRPSREIKERARREVPEIAWKVDAFCLCESQLTPRGAIRRIIETYPLAPR